MKKIVEEWRAVEGFRSLFVSNTGRVKTVAYVLVRKNGQNYPVAERIRKQTLFSDGYFRISAVDGAGYRRPMLVHRLIALAFYGAAPPGRPHCAHVDGNPTNNVLENLRWSSVAENTADSIRHGTHKKPPHMVGSGHARAKLSEADVVEIRRVRRQGVSGVSLARKYGVSNTAICYAYTGKNWGSVA